MLQIDQLALQPVDLVHDATAITLKLGLTRPSGTDAAFLLRKAAVQAAKARQPIAQQRQLNLGLAFESVGVLGEDVEDDGGAVDSRSTEDLFEVVLLGGAEFVVEHHGVGIDL